MKVKGKSYIIYIMLLMIPLLISGCSKKHASEEDRGNYEPYVTNEEAEEPYVKEQEQVLKDKVLNRKVIQNKSIVMETLEFEKVTKDIESLTNQYFGYVETSEVFGKEINNKSNYNTRNAYYTLRIPSEKLNEFTEELRNIGNIIHEQVYKEDVTTQYIDLQARINSLKVQEKRLLELLEKGAQLKDILEIENQLSTVRYEIETKTATQINLENLINFGTIKLEIREVVEVSKVDKPAITVGEKISKGFIKSINNIKEFFINLFVLIIVILPYLIVLTIIIGIIIFAISKVNKSKNKKKNNIIQEEKAKIKKEE